MDIYLQGLTMGLAYVAPIGLQNLFVINTALTQRKSRVYATAFIVIFFDVTLGLACFFGIGAIMKASPILEMAILGIGSLIVIWIGQGLVRAHDTMDTSTKVDIPGRRARVHGRWTDHAANQGCAPFHSSLRLSRIRRSDPVPVRYRAAKRPPCREFAYPPRVKRSCICPR